MTSALDAAEVTAGRSTTLSNVAPATYRGTVSKFRFERAANRRPIRWIECGAVAEPGDRPAVVQRDQRVRGRSGDQDARRGSERQDAVAVLRQHDRFASASESGLARRRRSNGRCRGRRRGRWRIEQADARLQRQDARNRVVDARDRHRAFVHELHEQIAEAVVARHHAHVDTCEHRGARRVFLVGRGMVQVHQLLDVFPVGDDHAIEAELPAQHIVQQVPVDVAGNPVDLAGVHHHRERTGPHTCREGRQQRLPQHHLRDHRRRAIVAARRHAIADIVFQRGADAVRRRGSSP